MSRAFNGQIHVRIPASVHEEVAKEAFDKGTSISGILAQALIVRRALRNIDPWKSIDEVQSANRGMSGGRSRELGRQGREGCQESPARA